MMPSGRRCSYFQSFLAGLDVDGEDAAVGGRNKHFTVGDHWLRFLAALLLATERHRPDRDQIFDGVGVDCSQRAVALALGAKAVGQNVAGGLGIVEDVSIGDVFSHRRAAGNSEGCGKCDSNNIPFGEGITNHGLSPELSIDSCREASAWRCPQSRMKCPAGVLHSLMHPPADK
jgi:hypothetical protein